MIYDVIQIRVEVHQATDGEDDDNVEDEVDSEITFNYFGAASKKFRKLRKLLPSSELDDTVTEI